MHLITSPSDIYSLTGVRPHDPGEILLVLPDKKEKRKKKKGGIILCDPRTSAIFDATRFDIIDQRDEWKRVLSQYKTLHTDPDFLTQTLREKIERYGVMLTMKKSPITEQRIIKSPQEIEKLRTAQKLNKAVYKKILPYLVPWVTEAEIARKIQILQLELGASGPSFPPIVAFGEHSAIPHHEVTDRKLQSGDPVLLDMGLVYRWYCSDMTRCLQLEKKEKRKEKKDGAIKSWDSFEEIYSLLQSIVETLVPMAKPGVKVSDLDKKAREMLGDDLIPYFLHSLWWHGIGIDCHEAPHVVGRSPDILQTGMVITIEPGLYFWNTVEMRQEKKRSFPKNQQLKTNNQVFGARYEEMVLVTERGGEVL